MLANKLPLQFLLRAHQSGPPKSLPYIIQMEAALNNALTTISERLCFIIDFLSKLPLIRFMGVYNGSLIALAERVAWDVLFHQQDAIPPCLSSVLEQKEEVTN